MKEELLIGSHVSMCAPEFVLGSVKEALSYGANAFMLYSGAPQNTKRQSIEKMKIKEAQQLMAENHIPNDRMIVHAPYIINLANTVREETYEIAVSFLKEEIKRCRALGAKYLVLHPGSHVKAGEDIGLASIVKGLNEAMVDMGEVCIALETMTGKGSELGYQFEQIAWIRSQVNQPDHVKVCLDTCHINDAGYDVSDFDRILYDFDRIIGLDNLVCIHLNDSKNRKGAKKDRHANLGFGEIGFEALSKVAYHEKLSHVVKILETPYVEKYAPYRYEIAMLRKNQFDPEILDKIKNQK